MCVANGANVKVDLNACVNCRARNQVIMVPAGKVINQTFMVMCICCQNATPVLPEVEARHHWNKENPKQ
jgi:hypothetical protein